MSVRSSRRSLPGLVARQAATGVGTTLTVAVIVFAIALLASGAPRAVAALFTDSLRAAVAGTAPGERNLTVTARGLPAPGPGTPEASALPGPLEAVWGRHEAGLASVRADMPAALRRVTGPAQYVVTVDPAPALPVAPIGAPHTQLSLAFDPHLAERVTIVEGPAPGAITGDLPSDAPIGILLSRASAERMQLAVGDERMLTLPGGSRQLVALRGIFEATDPDADYWEQVASSLHPTVLSAGMEPVVFGLAYADPASWPKLQPFAMYAKTQVWYPVLPERMTAAGAPAFAEGLRAFTRLPHAIGAADAASVGGSFPPVSSVAFASKLGRVVQEVAVRTAATSAVLAMTAAGPIGVALGALLLGARLIVDRRTTALRLAAARGASPGQLRAVLAAEGAVVGLPAAAAGTLVAALLVPGPPSLAGLLLPALVGLVPVALLAGSLPRDGRRRRTDLQRNRHRVILEVLIVGLAAASVLLLTQRGLTTATAHLGVDPLLAAAPLLLSLAACVLVLRLYPIPLQLLITRMKAGRGLVGFLGAVRAVRDPLAGFAPVLAMVVGVSVAVFSVGVLATVNAGVDAAARAATGADVRISAPYLSAEQLAAVGDLPGVASVAPVDEVGTTLTIDGGREPAAVLSAPVADLAAVQGGVPAALNVPARLGQAADDHMPVVVSADLAAGLGPDSHLELAGITLDVVGTAPSVSPLTNRRDWLFVDRANAEALTGYAPAPGLALVDLTADSDVRAATDGIRRVLGPDAVIDTPADAAQAAGADPAVRGLQAALLLAVLVAWLLTALTVILTLVLGTPARARLLALLRALGAPPRAAGSLVAWEIGPVAVNALVVGTVLGCALPLVVLAGVDLRPFTHGQVQPAFRLDPGLLAVVLGGFAVVVIAASAFALRLARRADQAGQLRSSEEG
ncbi:FtsX-like permease family protein [Cryobacterium tepidiphilum]|uniref:FtsX-like permease family protein n=1 Tax=Cryobacterium tepidiphilum TaxID=2486026 RepID=A0A3M8LFB6_9MICO|nr:FtsX-like permease family protein [Cryobacterium tepidiphilum]RNE64015.1 FtsX-like permease family protein [Cryobacterium tepidiphilum]